MDTISRNPRWNLKRKGLVWAPESPKRNAFLLADLWISHNIETKQGIISIRVTPNNQNPACPSQELTLELPPEIVAGCSWILNSDDQLCPSHLLPKVPRHGVDASSVSTLKLELDTAPKMFLPSNLVPLSPDNKDTWDFSTLENISQSKTLSIHFGRDQFIGAEINRLQIFLDALRKKSIGTLCLDHKRRGLTEGYLDTLRSAFSPPPYSEKPASEQDEPVGPPAYRSESGPEQMVRKSRNAPSSILPDNNGHERLFLLSSQPPGSPTEVNTQSTDSMRNLSPSPPPIRSTVFTSVPAPGRTEFDNRVTLERLLRLLPKDVVRRALSESDHSDLLGERSDVRSDSSPACEKASYPTVGMDGCHSMEDYIDAIVEYRLQSHANKIVNKFADENSRLLYDLVGECGEKFHSEFDDRRSELQNAVNDHLDEIEETFQDCKDQLEATGQRRLYDIQDQKTAPKRKRMQRENIAKSKPNSTRRRQLYGLAPASCKRRYPRLANSLN